VNTLGEIGKKIKFTASPLLNEPMSRHTSFRIGGPADVFVSPRNLEELSRVYSFCLSEEVPFFLLGGGANLLVADRGIRGAVIDLAGLQGCGLEPGAPGPVLWAWAGTPMSRVCEEALRLSLNGLEFIYSMPGSVGGSVWMNARCYGTSVSEVLAWVEILDEEGRPQRLEPRQGDFGYKRSPFQERRAVLLRAGFRLQPGERETIRAGMEDRREDRQRKGHFLYPCAGSVFKNNPRFGSPTGQLLDSLGLKGLAVGGARISPLHANIIVNTGGARAQEVLELIRLSEDRAREELGLELEREILLVGDWQGR